VLVTSKFYNDVFYGNHYLAFIGGVSLQELNLLEGHFLHLISWQVWVDAEGDHNLYKQGVLTHFQQRPL